MKKWLILIGVLILGVLAVFWWLGKEVETSKPEPGEVRMEIENVF